MGTVTPTRAGATTAAGLDSRRVLMRVDSPETQRGIADGAGRAEAVFDAAPFGQLYAYERIAVFIPTQGFGSLIPATVYIGAAADANRVDSTPVGEDDTAEYGAYGLQAIEQPLRIVWTGATPGDVCYAVAQRRLERIEGS